MWTEEKIDGRYVYKLYHNTEALLKASIVHRKAQRVLLITETLEGCVHPISLNTEVALEDTTEEMRTTGKISYPLLYRIVEMIWLAYVATRILHFNNLERKLEASIKDGSYNLEPSVWFKVQEAIKNKTQLIVSVRFVNGETEKFVGTPISIDKGGLYLQQIQVDIKTFIYFNDCDMRIEAIKEATNAKKDDKQEKNPTRKTAKKSTTRKDAKEGTRKGKGTTKSK